MLEGLNHQTVQNTKDVQNSYCMFLSIPYQRHFEHILAVLFRHASKRHHLIILKDIIIATCIVNQYLNYISSYIHEIRIIVLTPAVRIKQDVDGLWMGECCSVYNSPRFMTIYSAICETRVHLIRSLNFAFPNAHWCSTTYLNLKWMPFLIIFDTFSWSNTMNL